MKALKSKTVWLGVIVGLLPLAETFTGPITGLNPIAGAALSAAIIILRAVTTKPLSDK
jgi:hypothetical protein